MSEAQCDDRRAQEELLRRYEPLVRATVRRLRLPAGIERDDVAQEARVGLLRAIRAWQPGRGPFCAFAARCVGNQAMKAVDMAGAQKHRLLSQACSLDSPSISSASDGEDLRELCFASQWPMTRLADPEGTVVAREQLAEVCAGLSTLSHKERTVLVGVLNGRSHQQLAAELGGSKKAVALALRRARDKLMRAQRERVAPV